MPRPSNTQERRSQIAFALARVMAREGYDGASIAAIAREAGVAAGGVHYHFGSKAEILVDLVERLVERAQARVDVRMARARDGRGTLAAILDGLLELDATTDPDAVATWSLVAAEAVRSSEVRAVYAPWIEQARDRLRDAFVAACREEGRSARGATEAAGALVALVEGCVAVAAGAPGTITPGSAAPAARRIAMALLDAQPLR